MPIPTLGRRDGAVSETPEAVSWPVACRVLEDYPKNTKKNPPLGSPMMRTASASF